MNDVKHLYGLSSPSIDDNTCNLNVAALTDNSVYFDITVDDEIVMAVVISKNDADKLNKLLMR